MAEVDDHDLAGSGGGLKKPAYHARYEVSYAIVVGIDSYQHPRLRPLGNAESDARSIAEILSAKPYQFKVDLILGADATRRAITRALNKVIKQSQPDDRVLFYFAGHGYIQPDNRGFDIGYLACADTEPDDPFDGLEYDEVKRLTRYAKAKHIAFILDACFSGSALGLTRAALQTVAVQEYLLHSAYQVLTAGAVEVVKDAGSMSSELVRVLREGIPGQEGPFTFSHLGQHIHDVIHNQSRGRQSPVFGFLEGSSKGQMVLVTPSAVDALPLELRLGLTDQNALMRRFAITEAEKQLANPEMGEKVRRVLEEMQVDDEDRQVRRRAAEALRSVPRVPAGEPKPEPERSPADRVPGVIERAVPGDTKEPVIMIGTAEEKVAEQKPASNEVGAKDRMSPPRAKTEAVKPARDPILEILPAPFEWCDIPAGKVTLEDNAGTFEVKPFKMAKYPITYAQFQVFVDAPDGFKDDRWWQGLAARERQPGEQSWKIANHPRENVSWYAAVAFYRWLSGRTGYTVRLPLEWEWQWAAQGPDGREFPWGNDYIQGYANIDEKASGVKGGVFQEKTTPVVSYPQGASPFGVLDMAGNVWEWCLNEYDKPDNIGVSGEAFRVGRGGSWDFEVRYCRCASRAEFIPTLFILGFRVVLSLASSGV